MSNRLPDFIDPVRCADSKQTLTGAVPFSRMHRLTEIISNRDDKAEVDVMFDIDAQGLRTVQGRVRTEVWLACQRCLQPLKLPVDSVVSLGIIETESEAEQLPGNYDPLLVGDQPVSLVELVEDEILLGLPAFPRHEADACSVAADPYVTGTESETPAKKPNPFAVLARLKSN